MGAAAAEADRTLFVGNLETKVTEELLFELFHQEVAMPHRMSVCHIPSIILETQALPLHLLAGNLLHLLLKSFVRNFPR
uniref:RRM domain-containing protein n=1 Tax=Felis catus TaxID=9685 RepID=A0ABI7YL08_FELCA